MNNVNDKSINFLWKSFLDGDDKSFSIIYQLHIDRLLTYGYKLSFDKDLVHDSTQEVFIDLFLKRKKHNIDIHNLKSYLFVALRNNIVKKLEKNRKSQALETDKFYSENIFATEYSFQDHLIDMETSNELKGKLKRAITALPPRQKEMIYLKFEEEMDYPQISTILKISIESARKLLYRSLLTLRETVHSNILQTFFLFFKKKFAF